MTKAFIFLNGEFTENKKFYEELKIDEKHLYCADGGTKKAVELNFQPKEVWGDFDSLEENYIKFLEDKKVILKKFERDKNFTDGELLINYVASLGYEKIYILGGLGKRLDHMLTNINLIFKYENLIFLSETEKIFRVTENFEIKNSKEKIISFIPFSDIVKKLNLSGFKYNLIDYDLKRGESICMSNIISDEIAKVNFTEGKLIGIINILL